MVQAGEKFLTFCPSRLLKSGFLALKMEANFSRKNIKMKLTHLKKVSKVVHFTGFFLCACKVYSHFEFELK